MSCACHSHSWDVCEPRWASQPNHCIFDLFLKTPNYRESSQDKRQQRFPASKGKSAVVSTSLTLTLGNCRPPNLLSRLLSTKPIPVKRWRKYDVQMIVLLCTFFREEQLKGHVFFDSEGWLKDLLVWCILHFGIWFKWLSWWFICQCFRVVWNIVYFIPGEMIQFDEHILQMGWNHYHDWSTYPP